jgi:transposase-like protein
MVDEAKQLISEIRQIKSQYVAEVGKGRRVWPRSIRERAFRLDAIGAPAKAVAEETGIPYETLVSWRFNRRKGAGAGAKGPFHEIAVQAKSLPVPDKAPGDISKSMTVTVPKFEMPVSQPSPRSGLRLTTPEGIVIDGFDDEASVLRMLRLLICPSGDTHHAL